MALHSVLDLQAVGRWLVVILFLALSVAQQVQKESVYKRSASYCSRDIAVVLSHLR